jgi:hypothetical protein
MTMFGRNAWPTEDALLIGSAVVLTMTDSWYCCDPLPSHDPGWHVHSKERPMIMAMTTMPLLSGINESFRRAPRRIHHRREVSSEAGREVLDM